MCVVSMVMDHYHDKWKPLLPTYPTIPTQPVQPVQTIPQADIDEFYKLLERAREYDRKNNEPECELQEKKDALQAIAKALGVTIKFED